ncbi:MAG TPA: HAMP domain-containing sensor histidine kinase [Verrucomicrobiae bacterium]|nr:HAMP domain-containing sensor histidine kinase [Verrucomicrobiae bacterium]
MRKVAVVFVLAVLVPSAVLAWLAFRSLRDQQFVLERQQSLLYQGLTDALAKSITDTLSQQQRDFADHVESLMANKDARAAATNFDGHLRQQWPSAEVGFVVTLTGNLLCPSPTSSPEARLFCADNASFLGNRESAEVYWNANVKNVAQVANITSSQIQSQSPAPSENQNLDPALSNTFLSYGKAKARKVDPVQKQMLEPAAQEQTFSKVIPSEGEFHQLIGAETDGMLARFLQNKLKLMFWHRLNRDPQLVFGAQLALPRVIEVLRPLVQADPALHEEICVALLDENTRPTALTRKDFSADWKRPFVSSEIGEALPHWEVAVYLLNPAKLPQVAQTTRLTLGLLIALLVIAIGVGGWLIVSDLNRQLTLARQKTDFVSNVSHELKTPLTSIRMFAELLAEGRVNEPQKQKSYLNIITAETARLTRLINNVLDFSRMERGEKEYHFAPCDVVCLARETAEVFRPHLEAAGFRFRVQLPDSPITTRADKDAVSQIIVNLISNAEKYSNGQKEIALQLTRHLEPVPWVELTVLDRGPGVPAEARERIFEKFYRANDSLTNNVPGSGLGLTLARQIARAHGGDVVYAPREGGGSCFTLRLPVQHNSSHEG